jgi:hypothetical protein
MLIEISKLSVSESGSNWKDYNIKTQAEKFNNSNVKILYPSSENIYFKIP